MQPCIMLGSRGSVQQRLLHVSGCWLLFCGAVLTICLLLLLLLL
jgi:hypothetical protein